MKQNFNRIINVFIHLKKLYVKIMTKIKKKLANLIL